MMRTMICMMAFLVLGSCKKEKDRETDKKKTPLELLTQKKWILTSYGFDDNKNKRIDDLEEMIRDCENDNSYDFFTDLTGVARDNAKACTTGNPVNSFTWQFNNNNSGLLISSNPASIVTLSEDSLVLLYHIQGLVDGFIGIYKH